MWYDRYQGLAWSAAVGRYRQLAARDGMFAMTFKLVMSAEKNWRRHRDLERLAKVISGATFHDGTEVK